MGQHPKQPTDFLRPPNNSVLGRIVRNPQMGDRRDAVMTGTTLHVGQELFDLMRYGGPAAIKDILSRTPTVTWPELTPAGYAPLEELSAMDPLGNVIYLTRKG